MQHGVIIESLAARSNRVVIQTNRTASKAGGRSSWSATSDDSETMSFASVDHWTPDQRTRRRIQMARLEADMAYFQARIELIGEPCTSNQRAQFKLFGLLHKSLGGKLLHAKKRQVEAASSR